MVTNTMTFEKFIGKTCVIYTDPTHKFAAKFLKIVGDKAIFENSRGDLSLTPVSEITYIRLTKYQPEV